MHPQPAYPRVFSNPRRPYDSARRATDPTAEAGPPSPPHDAPPLRDPRPRRAENHGRQREPDTAPSNTSAPRLHGSHGYHHHAGGVPAGATMARKPVGSGSSTSSSSSRGRRPAAAATLSDARSDRLGAARPPPPDADGALSPWSRIGVAARTTDGSTAIEGSSVSGGSGATVASSSATVRSSGSSAAEQQPPPSGVQSPSGPRVVVGANVGLDGRDEEEEASAMAEDLAGLIVRSATKENLVRMRVLGLWSIKILVVLYLATCLWSVVTALVDAVVRLIAPVLTFFGFLLWILGA